jgi:hypothetical protein
MATCSTCKTTFLGEIEIEKRMFESFEALLTLIAGYKVPVSFYITLLIIILLLRQKLSNQPIFGVTTGENLLLLCHLLRISSYIKYILVSHT